MNNVKFAKLVAAGNDFVVIEAKDLKTGHAKFDELAKNICDRKYGVGADGLLILEDSKKADVRMRIFNPDGSEAEMCGNGARCFAKYFDFFLASLTGQPIKIETKAGIIDAFVSAETVKLKMPDPKDIRLSFELELSNSKSEAHYIDTGVPHAVIFVDDLNRVVVQSLGREIRLHKEFAPKGTNVDFVNMLENDKIAVRTYERGVEAETLACGTGTVASAIIYGLVHNGPQEVNVLTKSGEVLKVNFNKVKDKIKNVYLQGSARIVYIGGYQL